MSDDRPTAIQYRYAKARVEDYLRGSLRYSRDAYEADLYVVEVWENRAAAALQEPQP